MARMRLESLDDNRALLTERDGTPREFWCPRSGGYVREITETRPGTLGLQVCDRLYHSGNTLFLSHPEKWPLVNLIRREYQRRARQNPA